jgi:sigma-E factor negative regulatory protein RseA
MTDLKRDHCEWISALGDGELRDDELANVFDALARDPTLTTAWHTYQVIGDVLRSPDLAHSSDGLAFLGKLDARLAHEFAASCIDQSALSAQGPVVDKNEASRGVQIAANESVFRWKVLAGVACTALLTVVGSSIWTPPSTLAVGHVASIAADSQALKQGAVVVESSAGTMLRDPRLDELMAAHRQLGGHSALQVPAGFLRNATHEGSAR